MSVVSVRREPGVAYPPAGAHSPPEAFPESPFPGAAPGESRVYGLVRRCLADAGLDAGRFGTAAWNPLGAWIAPGERVFVLPNLVVDRRPGEALADFHGKCTHGSVLRAVLDYATIAAGGAERVAFGNASLQSCDYAAVAEAAGAAAVGRFYREHAGADAGPHDLRAVVTRWTRFGALLDRREREADDVVYVDLGADSLLEALSRGGAVPAFRVGDYDHREMAEYHGPGRHVYAVHRRVLEAGALVSVPKLKTHEKVGITCALKGTVGAIARKECLAHHRRGGPGEGGDEYPADTPVHQLASVLADRVTTMDAGLASNVARVAGKGLYKALRAGPRGIMAGAWHGNDTAWRMALDIARVLRFARPDGTLADTPQRRHLVVVDGVVGGEGEGPVHPRAVPAGVVVFGSDPVWTDVACALLMRFDPAAVPLVGRAVEAMRYAATDERDGPRVTVDGAPSTLSALAEVLERGFVPPKGWIGHVELQPDAAAAP